MLAVSQEPEDHEVHFRNCCGYLRVCLYGEGQTVKSVELAGNGSEPLAGKAELSVNRSGMPEVSICDDASMTLTLDCGEGVVLSSDQDKPTSFWFVIPPVDFSDGLRITVSRIPLSTIVFPNFSEILCLVQVTLWKTPFTV